jgi:pimeloyl-ACP methyl ester carboxylesterase
VIRYDQRGYGDSDDPEATYSAHGDALSVLDAAEVDRATVIGASMGGEAALDLTLAAPDRVEALVAVVATPSGWEHSSDLAAAFDAVEAAYESGGIDAANEVELTMWVDGPSRSPEDVEPTVREHAARMNHAALAREEAFEGRGVEVEMAQLEPPALGRLGEVTVPTLVVTGALDQPSVNAGAAAIAAGVPGAEAIEIADTAHLPSLERPVEFDRAVLRFLSERLSRG